MLQNKLTQKYLEKLLKGETINITDLYEFSNIKLKCSRIRKKFNKDYGRYISNEIKETYWGIIFTRPLLNSFKIYSNLGKDLISIKPMSGEPNIELTYFDKSIKLD